MFRTGNPLLDRGVVDLGLYDYSMQDPVLGYVAPSTNAIARTLVVRNVISL